MAEQKTILIVDDEKGFADFMRSLLADKGYQVRVAANGNEALSEIGKNTPDVAILDVSMPKMGGVELYTKISSKFGRPQFPVIVLTAIHEITDFFSDAFVDAFMTKPFQVSELMECIEKLLRGETEPVIFLADRECPEATNIAETLDSERFKVVRLGSAESLIKEIRSRHPDFIIMDVEFANGSLEDLVKKIKQTPEAKHTPLIVYSRSGLSDAGSGAVKAGADRYVGKPGDLKPLFFAIRQLWRKNIQSAQKTGT